MIKLSKEFSIDLNARDDIGNSPLHSACEDGKIRTETVEVILKELERILHRHQSPRR